MQYRQMKEAVSLQQASEITRRSYALFIINLTRAFVESRRYRTTIREPSALDDRYLNDIGVERGMIRCVARLAGTDRLRAMRFPLSCSAT